MRHKPATVILFAASGKGSDMHFKHPLPGVKALVFDVFGTIID